MHGRFHGSADPSCTLSTCAGTMTGLCKLKVGITGCYSQRSFSDVAVGFSRCTHGVSTVRTISLKPYTQYGCPD
eukprot:3459209-Prymnesium_polylepis.1